MKDTSHIVSNLLKDHFGSSKTWDIFDTYNVETVTDAQKLTDEQLLRCRNIGRMFIQKLRNLNIPAVQPSPFTKHTSRCIDKAGEKEPLFVLRGQDISSPRLVLLWMAENEGNLSDEKLREALECIIEMRHFPGRKKAD